MELRYNVIFKRGHMTIATIEGQRAIKLEELTISEVTQKIMETEVFLEKLTGLAVAIEQAN